MLLASGGGSRCPCHAPPPLLLEPRLKGLSPGQRAPGRVNSLPDLGPTVLASGAASPCSPVMQAEPLGALRQEEQSGPQKPPPSLSLPELQPLDHLPQQRTQSGVRPGSRTPEHGDFCTYSGGQPACPRRDGVQGQWAGPHSGVGGVGWPAPRACPPSSSFPTTPKALRTAPVGVKC